MVFVFRVCLFLTVFFSSAKADEKKSQDVYPVVVLGGGVGALSSSIYLARAQLHPIVIEGSLPGGLLTQSHSIQNWPGEIEINGSTLTEKMYKQAQLAGATFKQEIVTGVDFSSKPYKIFTKSILDEKKHNIYLTESVIIAMGTTPNYLNVEGEKTYWGKGVSNCALCEGNLYKDKTVAVIGGGDSAVLEAVYLSGIAKKVFVIVRKDRFRAKEKKRLQVMLDKKNVEVIYSAEVKEILGNGEKIEFIKISQKGFGDKNLSVSGVFLAIGSTPNSSVFSNHLSMDKFGYITLKKGQQTSKEGVFAAGDIVDRNYKQAITAAGDAVKAAIDVESYLSLSKGSAVAQSIKTESLVAENLQEAKPIDITSLAQFKKELTESQTPVLVDFYATWCGPCRKLTPFLTQAAKTHQSTVKVLKVNVEKNRPLAEKYSIGSIPTVILFDSSGKILEKASGYDACLDIIQRLP